MNNITNPHHNDSEVATAGAQLSSMQSKDSSANTGGINTGAAINYGGININTNTNTNNNVMMARRESIGMVNAFGDALFGGRRPSGFGGMGGMGGMGNEQMETGGMARRGSMDSVVDAAILNLANRRLSMFGGTTHAPTNTNTHANVNPMSHMAMGGGMGGMPLGINNSMINVGGAGMPQATNNMNNPMMNGVHGNGNGMGMGMGMSTQMNQFLINGLGISQANAMAGNNNHSNNQASSITGTTPNADGDSDTTVTTSRQQILQDQRFELQRRQKELEFQRQQLLTAMEERKQAMQHMQQTMQQGGIGGPGSEQQLQLLTAMEERKQAMHHMQQSMQQGGKGGLGPEQQLQLLTAMEERKQAMHHMQQTMQQGGIGGTGPAQQLLQLHQQQQQRQQAEPRHSLLGSIGGGFCGGFGGAAPGTTTPAAEHSNNPNASGSAGSAAEGGSGGGGGAAAGSTNFFVCKFCNSKAYSNADEALACENACRLKLENTWRQNSGMRDDRRGSLDLLGALAGVTQAVDSNNSGNNNNNNNNNLRSFQNNTGINNVAGRSNNNNSGSSSCDPLINAPPSANFSTMKQPIPLGLSADKDWLTPLHCFVRLNCVEVFTASEGDVAIPTKGKRKPIQIGQVGIRCPHCHNSETGLKSRERGSVYYPTSVASIYNATMNLLQRHLHSCTSVKHDVMKQYETLKSDDARSGTSKKYWAKSALSLGLIDTPQGIRFSDLEPPPLPSLTSQQKSSDNYSDSRGSDDAFFNSASNALTSLKGGKSDKQEATKGLSKKKETSGGGEGGSNTDTKKPEYTLLNVPAEIKEDGILDSIQDTEQSLANSAPLVTPDDEKVATQFSFYLLGQMQMCVFTEADRLGKRKGLPPGFPGLACRHCFGGYGSGRFFPSSIKTLSDTSKTLNVLFNHMMRCRKCPAEVRDTLEKLRKVHDEQRAKMKFGSQKAFFARIWDRLHDNDPTVDSHKRKFQQPKKAKPKPAPVQHNGAAGNLMNLHSGVAHLGQHPYLDPTNAFTGGLSGLSTAGLMNGFGVGGMLQGNNAFNPSAAQYTGDSEANKRLKLHNLAPNNRPM